VEFLFFDLEKKLVWKKFIFDFFQSIWVSTKKFSPIGPAVWWATGNIYIYLYKNVLFYRLQIYTIKQDIHIYVAYSQPKCLTEWAEFLCGHSWVAGGCNRL